MRRRLASLLPVLALAATTAGAGQDTWFRVDYGALVDRTRLTHSGESVGTVLDRLDGRPVPRGTERPRDRIDHSLLDPLLEPYAFVVADALDARDSPSVPWTEIGALWSPGEPQPAWVELFRARRFVLESDGEGRLRALLPASEDDLDSPSAAAARGAWERHRPVLRLALAAERLRLSGRELKLDVHAYVHRPAISRFLVGAEAYAVSVDDTRPSGARPPFDLAALTRFLGRGLRLEGARLTEDGGLVWLGSEAAAPPTLLGRPLSPADFAVAYRAVFHGGLAEPYMSLDRGPSPQTSIVNYGGRLRDTALGWVSLLCDIRFKTFSEGIDVVTGRDVREEVRTRVEGFRTHLERLARHPESAGMSGQQTRLWFYPDDVDLTLSEPGDVLVLRKVRMSAASERFDAGTGAPAAGEDPPWTRATVRAINTDYDGLIEVFPELGDLDQVVRLLSLFTWMKFLEEEGYALPELDALLAIELPALSTPRTYPQLLAFNALPEAGSERPVTVYGRVRVAEALDRLDPAWGPGLAARDRFVRAVAALDPSSPEQAELAAELAGVDPPSQTAEDLDAAAYRAERLMMHQLVLHTLPAERRDAVAERFRSGERLRVFSVGIGGLDLGMGQALSRATGRRLGVGRDASDASPRPVPGGGAGAVRETWRVDPPGIEVASLPAFPARERDKDWHRLVHDPHGREPRARLARVDRGRMTRVERLEGQRSLAYRFATGPEGLVAQLDPVEDRAEEAPSTGTGPLPSGAAILVVSDAGSTPGRVELRIAVPADGDRRVLETPYPRDQLRRLVLGREVDKTPGQPLPGFAPLPPALGDIETLLLPLSSGAAAPPWIAPPRARSGDLSAPVLARALSRWWGADGRPPRRAAVAVDGGSEAAWARAPRPDARALLVVPERLAADVRGRGGRVVTDLPSGSLPDLVMLVDDRPLAVCAEQAARLSGSSRMKGKLLALWCLDGTLRPDQPPAWLRAGGLAGLGIAESTLVTRRELAARLSALADALAPGGRRVEGLAPWLLWYF